MSGYLILAIPVALALAMALMIMALIATATLNPWVPVAIVYAVFTLDTALMFPVALKMGLWIYPSDLAALVFFAALLVRLLFFGVAAAIPAFWWILGGIQLALFAWGLLVNGSAAGVDYRPHFYVWVGAAYLATFTEGPDRTGSFLRFLTPLALALTAVAAYRWTMGAVDWQFQQELDRYVTTDISYRVIWSGATFIIAMAMLGAFHRAFMGSRETANWLSAFVFAAVVLVLQHRSVWVASLAGIASLLWLHARRRPGKVGLLTPALAGLAIMFAVGFSQVGTLTESVRAQAARALNTHEGTFAGRVTGWQSLLSDWAGSGSVVTYLIGKPYGSGYTRYATNFGGGEVGYSPHNFYVQLLYRGGLLGLLSFVWFAVSSLRMLVMQSRHGDDNAMLLAAILISLFVYYIPYGMTYEQILPVGLALALLARQRQGLSIRPASSLRLRRGRAERPVNLADAAS